MHEFEVGVSRSLNAAIGIGVVEVVGHDLMILALQDWAYLLPARRALIGKYIVVFKEGVTKDQIEKFKEEISQKGGNIEKELDNINGFSATIPEGFLSEFQSSANAVIDYIEPDGVVTTQD
ncbi:hypothetical protein C8R43DRAFT_1141155 [Mycena crocata]|nr:hypothetical protein C8R43DRAFT_1141155 [Mycena crocata]